MANTAERTVTPPKQAPAVAPTAAWLLAMPDSAATCEDGCHYCNGPETD